MKLAGNPGAHSTWSTHIFSSYKKSMTAIWLLSLVAAANTHWALIMPYALSSLRLIVPMVSMGENLFHRKGQWDWQTLYTCTRSSLSDFKPVFCSIILETALEIKKECLLSKLKPILISIKYIYSLPSNFRICVSINPNVWHKFTGWLTFVRKKAQQKAHLLT